MTTRRYITVWCDNVTDGERCVEFLETADGTAQRARKTATSEGWTVGLSGGRDLCPLHDRLLEVGNDN